VHVHLERLVTLEYVLVHRGRQGQSFEYELLYDGEGQDGRPFLTGLLDVETLRSQAYDGKSSGSGANSSGRFGPDSGVFGPPPQRSLSADKQIGSFSPPTCENAHLDAARMPSCRTSAAPV